MTPNTHTHRSTNPYQRSEETLSPSAPRILGSAQPDISRHLLDDTLYTSLVAHPTAFVFVSLWLSRRSRASWLVS